MRVHIDRWATAAVGGGLVALAVLAVIVLPWEIPQYSDYLTSGGSSRSLSPAWRTTAIVLIAGCATAGFVVFARSAYVRGRSPHTRVPIAEPGTR